MYELDGKVALVTGAGGKAGIGRGIATRLASEGASVVVCDLNDNEAPGWGGLPAVVDEINAAGGRAIRITGDVSQSSDVDSMIEGAISEFGRIDILVNNAGAPAGPDRVPVVDLPEEVWDLVLNVNLKGTFLMSQAASRHMIHRGGGGKIINMSSVSGKKGVARFAAYCSSKFGVIGFTQSLAYELGEHKINVNAVGPGAIATEGLGGSLDQAVVDGYRRSVPWGARGRPQDIGHTIAFLASDEARYITGQVIYVDGGMSIETTPEDVRNHEHSIPPDDPDR